MAQQTYYWNQARMVGVAPETKEKLERKLTQLIDLLDATKEPCVTAKVHLENARILVKQLSEIGQRFNLGEWLMKSETLHATGKAAFFTGKLVVTGMTGGITAPILVPDILEFFYENKDTVQEIAQNTTKVAKDASTRSKSLINSNAASQLASVDALRSVILEPFNPGSIEEKSERVYHGLIKSLLQQHFAKTPKEKQKVSKIQWDEKSSENWTQLENQVKEWRDNAKNGAIRKKELDWISQILHAVEAEKTRHRTSMNPQSPSRAMMPLLVKVLRIIAFKALGDFYTKIDHVNVKCDILNVFGEVATLRHTHGVEVDSSFEGMGLITVEAQQLLESVAKGKSIIFNNEGGLYTDYDKKYSKVWELRCTAIETLVRCNFWCQSNQQQGACELTGVLDTMAQEYKLVSLLRQRLGFTEKQIASLRKFIIHDKSPNMIKEKRRKGSVKILSDEQKEVEKTLQNVLELSKEESKNLLSFLRENKDHSQKNRDDTHIPYREHEIRPVLDKIIQRFYITPTERALVDKAIFQAWGKIDDQISPQDNLEEVIKDIFSNSHTPEVTCTFHNLEKIRSLIRQEAEILKEIRTETMSSTSQAN